MTQNVPQGFLIYVCVDHISYLIINCKHFDTVFLTVKKNFSEKDELRQLQLIEFK